MKFRVSSLVEEICLEEDAKCFVSLGLAAGSVPDTLLKRRNNRTRGDVWVCGLCREWSRKKKNVKHSKDCRKEKGESMSEQ